MPETNNDDLERPIRIVVADDDEDIRNLIGDFVRKEPSMELVGSAADTDESIRVIQEMKPDVAVVDWVMPGGGGTKTTSEIKASAPETRIIGFTGADAIEASYDMMTAGAMSFLSKPCTKDELLEAIRGAMRW